MTTQDFDRLLFSLSNANENQIIGVDIETTGLSRDAEIISAAIAINEDDKISAFSFWLDRFNDYCEESNKYFNLFLSKSLFKKSYKGTIIFHNMDFDLKMILDRFYKKKILNFKSLCKLHDTLTISRIYKNNKFVDHADPEKLSCHSLKFLGKECLNDFTQSSFEDVVQDRNIRTVNRDEILKYNEKDADLTVKVFQYFKQILSKKEWNYIERVASPQIKSIVHMNWYGVPYDLQKSKKMKDDLAQMTEKLELEIFELVGRPFKITSQKELAETIFYNKNLTTVNSQGDITVLKPLFSTEKGNIKVDIDTLIQLKDINGKKFFSWISSNEKKITITEKSSLVNTWNVIDKIVTYLEANKAISFLESHSKYVKQMENGLIKDKKNYKVVYPNFSATAKSGRFKSTNPNLLGMPKELFKKLNQLGKWLPPKEMSNTSVRHTLTVPKGYKVLSIDISALDLSVVTFGAKEMNKNFDWVDLFHHKEDIDIHLEIGKVAHPDKIKELASQIGIKLNLDEYHWTKPDNEKVKLIHKDTSETKVFDVKGSKNIYNLIRFRKMIKEVNLSSSYMIGAQSLAINISKKIDEQISKEEAESLLDGFYNAFPEITRFQDKVLNLGYKQGYIECPFGRKYYMDCYDNLNEHYEGGNDSYEFIWYFKNRYWYVKAKNWKKYEDNIIEGQALTKRKFGFTFENIEVLCPLDPNIFDKKKSQNKSKFNRPKETSQEDNTGFKLSRIEITEQVQRSLKFAEHGSIEAENIIRSLIYEGEILLPEKGLLFYRVPTRSLASRYFHPYKKFKSTAKKFFPLYCQGVATTLATMALNEIREEIEKEGLEAQILLFVHDQIDVMVSEKDLPRMQEIMSSAISGIKEPFDIKLSGKFEKEEPLDHVA